MPSLFLGYQSIIFSENFVEKRAKESVMRIADILLTWYEGCKRDLPWRKDKDPYKIWVSEVMLQQTQVEVVRSYFERWMERFPTLESLAEAQEEEVIQYWQGLGYYSRARNLLQGVREVSASYGGLVPGTKEEVVGLAGVGDYTAGAILSIAYNQKEPAIDGNVLRVFSRLFCIEGEISATLVKRRIKELVEREIPVDHPGDFNQALMDLGATICIPKVPRCVSCPLQSCCCANDKGLQQQLPVKKKKTPPLPVRLVAGVMQEGGFFLLRCRPTKGLLAGMWEFPAVEIQAGDDEMAVFQKTFFHETGQEIEWGRLLLQCTHTFSHRKWDISFYHCTGSPGLITAGSHIRWVHKRDWEKLSFAGPHRKMAYQLKDAVAK